MLKHFLTTKDLLEKVTIVDVDKEDLGDMAIRSVPTIYAKEDSVWVKKTAFELIKLLDKN